MSAADRIKEKFSQYKHHSEAEEWLDRNTSRVKNLFRNRSLRDFIFEPFKAVFDTPLKTIDADIYSVITQVAIINAVLAGLPGKMGVGVYVSMALEAWMAFSIAKHVGIDVRKPSDVWKYFGLLAASIGVVLFLFRTLLGFGFSLFSIIPEINPLIFAELFVTDLVGVLFWVGFEETKKNGSFTIPKRMLKTIGSQTKGLFKHQFNILKSVFNLKNIKTVGIRIVSYLRGDFPVDQKIINGETFATAAMAYLLAGHYDKLQGPMGDIFIEAIRLRWSAQFDENSSFEEIASVFSEYDADQIEGVINTVKGKMFEIMVTDQENLDGDNWYAKMHTDETFPGSDIVFTNIETGEQVEVSLKAVAEGNHQIIEHALARYPDMPIMTTEEMAANYSGNDMVFGSGVFHEELQDVSEERYEELVSSIQVNASEIVIGGVSIGFVAALWPFVMAYLRNKISYEQLEKVFEHVLGNSGVILVSRISYATLFGPLFAWYLLARCIQGLVKNIDTSRQLYLEFEAKTSHYN